MKWKRSKRYQCIKADSAEEFEQAVNNVLDEYPDAEMTIDVLVPFLCHAWIKCERLIPETKADEYELKGEKHYCIECPYIDRPANSNRNQKKFPCEYADYGITRTNMPCCDKFYEWYEKQQEGKEEE